MPRADKLKRWDTSETLGILKFLNDNFDMWYENHLNACAKAMEAANVTRDAKSAYNKVHSMIKIMEDYDKTQKLPNDPIWENKKIFNLVKGIYKKTKEKKDQKTTKVKMTTTNTTAATNTSTINQMMDVDVPQVSKEIKETFEVKFKEYQDLPEQINKCRTELKETQEKADQRRSELKELDEQIKQIKSELKEKDEKLETLANIFKNFQNDNSTK